jgi:hypothetical protein
MTFDETVTAALIQTMQWVDQHPRIDDRED